MVEKPESEQNKYFATVVRLIHKARVGSLSRTKVKLFGFSMKKKRNNKKMQNEYLSFGASHVNNLQL